MFRFLFIIFILKTLLSSNEVQTYSICVCTTTTLENALNCKNSIKKTYSSDIFIVKEQSQKYRTFLGSFKEYSKAKSFMYKSSDFVKKQNPFIRKHQYELKDINKKDFKYIDLYNKTKEKTSLFDEIKFLDELKLSEEFKSFGSVIIDKYTPSLAPIRKVDNLLSDYAYFDNLIIEVDSSNNMMNVRGKGKHGVKVLKTYKVSTAKKSIKKPLGEGSVTSIALNPVWYPTQDTIESFKKRGITLPLVVPGGDKLNYMGSAKINLTHRVDGKETFRIHGTIDEKTIGSYESSGCIRMKNSEVIQLVSILNEFIDFKSMKDIKVVLK
jgi:hypothetical protein